VLPLLGALKRTPAQARAEFMAQMQAQQEGGGPEPEPEQDPPAEPQQRADGTDGAPRGSPVERPAT
jgi:hypothetical protein